MRMGVYYLTLGQGSMEIKKADFTSIDEEADGNLKKLYRNKFI